MRKIFWCLACITLVSFFVSGCTTAKLYHEVEPESELSSFIWAGTLTIVEFDGEAVPWGNAYWNFKVVHCKPGTHTIIANYRLNTGNRVEWADGLELTYDFVPEEKYVIAPDVYGNSIRMKVLKVGIGYNQKFLKYFK